MHNDVSRRPLLLDGYRATNSDDNGTARGSEEYDLTVATSHKMASQVNGKRYKSRREKINV